MLLFQATFYHTLQEKQIISLKMSVFVDIMGATSQVGACSHLATAEDWERSSQYNGRNEPSGRSEQVGKR